jgi:hypothetical protein
VAIPVAAKRIGRSLGAIEQAPAELIPLATMCARLVANRALTLSGFD